MERTKIKKKDKTKKTIKPKNISLKVNKEHWFCKSKENQGILLIILASSITVIKGVSPIKTTFCVVMLSLACATEIYNKYISAFPPCATIISFSSGIIILFCYCSIISNYERKINRINKNILIWITFIVITMSISEAHTRMISDRCKTNIPLSTPFIVTAIIVVVLTIKTINKRIFSPVKSLNSSYSKEN